MKKIYTPCFRWSVDGAGESFITDNGNIVARFYGGTDRLPDDRFAPLRPVSLHDVRFFPGGPAMIDEGEVCGPVCLSWRKHLIFNMEVSEVKADERDPGRFCLLVRTTDTALRLDRPSSKDYRPGNVSEETKLELYFDARIRGYVYDIRTSLRVAPGREEFILENCMRGLEFADLLPSGAFDNFPPEGRKKYTHVIYESRDGKLYNRPQNRHLGPDKRDIFYSPGGFLAFVAEKEGNPAVQFLDRSGSLAWSEICWAMYDVHFKYKSDIGKSRIMKGLPLEVRYRIYSIPPGEAERMLEISEPDPVLEDPLVRCPVFSGFDVNTFDPSDEYLRPSDKWFWQMSDTSCAWDWDTGFGKGGSLSISRQEGSGNLDGQKDAGKSQWELYTIGKVFPLSGRYEIRAMIRTEDVKGKVYMSWEYQDFSSEAKGIEASCKDKEVSESFSGTTGWTEVVFSTSENVNAFFPCLYLVLEGTGKCWFDDLHIHML